MPSQFLRGLHSQFVQNQNLLLTPKSCCLANFWNIFSPGWLWNSKLIFTLFTINTKVRLWFSQPHSAAYMLHAPARRPNNLIVPKKSSFLDVAISIDLRKIQRHLKARLPLQTDEIRQVTIMSMYRYTTSCIQGIRHKMANSWTRRMTLTTFAIKPISLHCEMHSLSYHYHRSPSKLQFDKHNHDLKLQHRVPSLQPGGKILNVMSIFQGLCLWKSKQVWCGWIFKKTKWELTLKALIRTVKVGHCVRQLSATPPLIIEETE